MYGACLMHHTLHIELPKEKHFLDANNPPKTVFRNASFEAVEFAL